MSQFASCLVIKLASLGMPSSVFDSDFASCPPGKNFREQPRSYNYDPLMQIPTYGVASRIKLVCELSRAVFGPLFLYPSLLPKGQVPDSWFITDATQVVDNHCVRDEKTGLPKC